MPRKNNLQLLQEAIAAGDLERASSLASKLEKSKKVNIPKPKAATKPKRKTQTTPKPKKRNDIAAREMDESEYLAPSRPEGFDGFSGRKFIGPDGKEHVYARRVSMQGTKFVNKFNPSDYDRLPAKLETFDKKQQRKKPNIPRRPPAKKVQVQCSICGDNVLVYPWEAETVDSEGNFRCSKKRCVKMR